MRLPAITVAAYLGSMHWTKRSVRNWVWIALVLVFICLSSSGIAGTAADYLFRGSYAIVIGVPASGHWIVYHWSYLVAEKTLHVAMFMAWAFLLSRKVGTSVTLAAAAVVACLSEYFQAFFPNRDPELSDCLIDIAAAVAGALLYRRVRHAPQRQ